MNDNNSTRPEQSYSQEKRDTMRTAFLTSFPKIFTDIPFTQDIFSASLRLAHEWDFSFSPEHFVANLAVELEARHKALSAAIRTAGAHGTALSPYVMELGAGLSSRRLEFRDSPYVEIDLGPIIEIKKEIYRVLNHRFLADELIVTDLSQPRDIKNAFRVVAEFSLNHPLVVVSEGLFWYLSRSDVDELAGQVHSLLSSTGGIWVTGDCPPVGPPPEPTGYKSIIAKSSKKEMDKPFRDFEDFREFFSEHGFVIESMPLESFVAPGALFSAGIFSPVNEQTLERMRSYTDIAILRMA